MKIRKIISTIIQIVNTTVKILAKPGIPAPSTAPTKILKTTISSIMKDKNDTSLENVFQRKIKKFIIFVFCGLTIIQI